MDDVGAFLVWLLVFSCVVGIFLTLIWPGLTARSRARRSTLEILARKLGGRVDAGLFGVRGLSFEIDGRPARLRASTDAEDMEGFTRLRVGGPVGARLRVVLETTWERIKGTFGSPDLTLGDPVFDPAYRIQGSDPERIRSFLDPARRALFLRLRLSLEAGPAGLLFTTPGDHLGRPGALEPFLRESISLGRAWLDAKQDGVRVTSVQELVVAGACPVCAHPLGAAPRRCGACATPHHAECWTYFGGCSTYACKENP